MSYKILRDLFLECLDKDYQTVENAASFHAEIENGTLRLFFEPSNGEEDWINNLNFRVRPYDDMDPVWYCHAGFLKVFKSALPYLKPYMDSESIHHAITVGYSHGAALSILFHEAMWFRRPDLRGRIKTFAYGAPRVLYAPIPQKIRARFHELYLIQNAGDIVTRVPPAIFGFRHVGNVIAIGQKNKYNAIDAHRPESYLAELDLMI